MEETVTITEAARRLGVSRNKVGTMVRDGQLTAWQNPLDKRERLIPLQSIEELRAGGSAAHRLRPLIAGIVSDPTFQSEDVEDYLDAFFRAE